MLYVQARIVDSAAHDNVTSVLRDEVLHGTLWLNLQVGIVCGVLLWQVGIAARHGSVRVGLAAGIVIGIIEGGAGVWFGAPPLFLIALIVLIVGSGAYGGYVSDPSLKEKGF